MMKGLLVSQQEDQENMSNLTSASNEASASSSVNINDSGNLYPQQYFNVPPNQDQQPPAKKKRNLPGNPDPDSEVIALSPKTLMATNRFVCQICNKGFQRDQNLQLHKRGHNLPWKLKQRTSKEIRRKVYVCPEVSCVHHDPTRALGDLTGIKKHFCRKHGEKKWKCEKCSKRYAVQSDWKAHSKTCGTREYRCDCGTLFSRRDSFITHRAFCDALAEESARSISGNLILSSASASGQAQVHHQQPQFNGHDHHSAAAGHLFSMKKEQQTYNRRSEIPVWLADPSSILFHQQHPNNSRLGQEFTTEMNDNNNNNNQVPSPNPNSSSSLGGGPTTPTVLQPYHRTCSSPHISATALLQKVAQMGATMSSNKTGPHHDQTDHVSPDSISRPNTTGFVLNLSSRDQEFVNGALDSSYPVAAGSTNASLLQDMMNSISSGFDGSTFEDALDIGFHDEQYPKRVNPVGEDGGGRGGGGNDGMTRDFLGLRPISQNDIFNIAGLGNCMNTTSNEQHQNTTTQRSWQGQG